MTGMRNLVVLFAACIALGSAQRTLKSMIEQDPDLSEFRKVLYNNKILLLLQGSTTTRTVFAPTNEAFNRLSDRRRSYMRGNNDKVKEILHYHMIAGSSVRTTDLDVTEPASSSTLKSSPLFFQRVQDSYFVNGARINRTLSNLQASNGVLHYIDNVLFDLPSTDPLLAFLKSPQPQNTPPSAMPSIRLFYDWVNRISNTGNETPLKMALRKEGITLFVPSDEAIQRIAPNMRNTITRDFAKLGEILSHHVIENDQMYYSNMFEEDMRLGKGMGESRPTIQIVEENGMKKYYINTKDNAKAEIIYPNVTCANGVVHIIDNLLYVYRSIYQTIQGSGNVGSDASDFTSYVSRNSEIQNLLSSTSGRTTLVVPVNLAVSLLKNPPNPEDKMIDQIRDNRERLRDLLRAHIIEGEKVTTTQIGREQGGIRRLSFNSMLPNGRLSFFRYQNNTYVHGNHTTARVLLSDIGAINGIVHYIDRVLGVPFRRTGEDIKQNSNLLKFYERLMEHDLYPMLEDRNRQYTIFAFNNSGYYHMNRTQYGEEIIEPEFNDKFGWVMRRHIVEGIHYLDDITGRGNLELQTLKDVITVKQQNQEYYVQIGVTQAKVIMWDMATVNGVVHIIDEVLFIDGAGGDIVTSGATYNILSSLLLVFATLYQLML